MMSKKTISLYLALVTGLLAAGQHDNAVPRRLKVFVDCNGGRCDMSYIRSEIKLIDFLLDNQAADVHLLVTAQPTGNGGSQYQLIFFGQNIFKGNTDTLYFNTDDKATNFEIRARLIKTIELGLAPFVAKTGSAGDVEISFKKKPDKEKTRDSAAAEGKDRWNFWVYRIGTNGNINGDEVYKNFQYSSEVSANRTTDKLKVLFSLNAGNNRSTFDIQDSVSSQKIIVKNHSYNFWHYLIASINDHWSYGYEVSFNQNSFSNIRGQAYCRTAAEYDIFPYRDVNNRYITFSYGLTVSNNHYYDTTIYEKKQETLFGQRADISIVYTQKWGSASVGIDYKNYFHDWKLFNFGATAFTNIRITGGLSFTIYLYGALTRDQVNLPKGGATEQEILTRRRQVASGYSFSTSFGLNYRFGSRVNNFVNPRFEGPSN